MSLWQSNYVINNRSRWWIHGFISSHLKKSRINPLRHNDVSKLHIFKSLRFHDILHSNNLSVQCIIKLTFTQSIPINKDPLWASLTVGFLVPNDGINKCGFHLGYKFVIIPVKSGRGAKSG